MMSRSKWSFLSNSSLIHVYIYLYHHAIEVNTRKNKIKEHLWEFNLHTAYTIKVEFDLHTPWITPLNLYIREVGLGRFSLLHLFFSLKPLNLLYMDVEFGHFSLLQLFSHLKHWTSFKCRLNSAVSAYYNFLSHLNHSTSIWRRSNLTVPPLFYTCGDRSGGLFASKKWQCS